MHINKTLPLALALIGVAAPAFAVEQGETYLGGGFGMGSFNEDGVPEFNPTFGIGRIGYGVTDNFAVEGRLGFGISGDSNTANFGQGNVDLSLEIDSIAAVYGVGYLPVGSRFSAYGLLGMAAVDVSVEEVTPNRTISSDESETDLSYGIGAEVDFTDQVAGYVEWVQYFGTSSGADDYDLSGVSLGAKYSF